MDFKLTNRYVLSGILKMKTGLHIGGGSETFATDSPVIRDSHGRPFIPGSSFKGVLRSSVEKILPVLEPISGVWSCQLFSESEGAGKCLSTAANQKKFTQLREEAGNKTKFKNSQVLCESDKSSNADKVITEQFILKEYLSNNLCDTCKVFGSPVFGSKIKIRDLHICEPYFELSELRDGVGIDRDSEVAVDQAKFDFEVIPSQSEFKVNIIMESPSHKELAILALGIREFVSGNAAIGGLSSRGLGACLLEIEKIEFMDFTNEDHLEKFFIEGSIPRTLSEKDFFNFIKTELLTKKGGNAGAQTTTQ